MQAINASSQTLVNQAQYPALAQFIQSLGYLPGWRYLPGDKPEQGPSFDDGWSWNGDC